MAYRRRASHSIIPEETNHIPQKSVFYQRIIPAILVFMAVLTVLLIVFAAAVLMGIVQF
jgi:hypothetical protein